MERIVVCSVVLGKAETVQNICIRKISKKKYIYEIKK